MIDSHKFLKWMESVKKEVDHIEEGLLSDQIELK